MATLDVHKSVQNYYGKVLKTNKDLVTGCCSSGPPPEYVKESLKKVPQAVLEKYYGCGNTIPPELDSCHVVDLGCGSGRDCYLTATLVGSGKVTGVDMTDEQLQVARDNVESFGKNIGYTPDMQFLKGQIEDLKACGVEDGSVDVVISNCVVNLSPNKPQVFASAFTALKSGGEMYFSDVYSDRRLSEKARNNSQLVGECIGGALYIGDFLKMVKEIGFEPVCVKGKPMGSCDCMTDSKEWKDLLGDAKFSEFEYRLIKPLEVISELKDDYQQSATYNGSQKELVWDETFTFVKGVPTAVDAYTVDVIMNSRYRDFFTVSPKKAHQGPFQKSKCCDSQKKGCCSDTKSSNQPCCQKSGLSGCK